MYAENADTHRWAALRQHDGRICPAAPLAASREVRRTSLPHAVRGGGPGGVTHHPAPPSPKHSGSCPTPPPQFGGGVASRREERAKGLAGERAPASQTQGGRRTNAKGQAPRHHPTAPGRGGSEPRSRFGTPLPFSLPHAVYRSLWGRAGEGGARRTHNHFRSASVPSLSPSSRRVRNLLTSASGGSPMARVEDAAQVTAESGA
jgi:hypothetical protein